MKILAISDQESRFLWDYYTPGKLAEYDLILSCGDLNASYLSFLVTMGSCPLFYVHGNHDTVYDKKPPEGCDCIDDRLVIYKGLRILGLGGSRRYREGKHQYTEKQMEKRIRRLKKAIKAAGGVDIIVTHAAPRGIGDDKDIAHQGFEAFLNLINQYHPQYLLHGHVHMNYGYNIPRTQMYHDTVIVNCYEKTVLDCTPKENRPVSFWSKLLHNLNIF